MPKRRQIKGKPLNLPKGLELEYARELEKLANTMTSAVTREMKDFFADHSETFATGQDASNASIKKAAGRLVARLLRQMLKMYEARATDLATSMVMKASKESSTRFKSSLKELSGGITLKGSIVTPGVERAMADHIRWNVQLIKSIPTKYLGNVEKKVMESITTGNGLADLVPYLQEQGGVTYRRAKNIAEDQTRKAYNTVNMERMKGVGIKKFQWMHSSGGQHPRELHITPYPAGLNGGIFSFDDLPVIDEHTGETGIPGDAVNCRCRLRPVLDVTETKKK